VRRYAAELRTGAPHLRQGILKKLLRPLLQEGKDWHAAEQALRNVLTVAPNDIESRSKLTVFMR